MLQFGNLAMICAGRPDVSLAITNGSVTLCTGSGPERHQLAIDWRNNDEVSRIIYELNHGSLQKEATHDSEH